MIEYVMSRAMYESLKKEKGLNTNKAILQYINRTFGLRGYVCKFKIEG